MKYLFFLGLIIIISQTAFTAFSEDQTELIQQQVRANNIQEWIGG